MTRADNRKSCEIRPCREEDLPAVQELYRQLTIDGEPTPLAELRQAFADNVGKPGFEVFVAELKGRVVGTYTLYILPNLTNNGRQAAILENIVVYSECRGAGVGRAMLDHGKQLATERGCYKLSLTTNAVREEAHRFYEHCGMFKHGYCYRYKL